MSAPLSAIPRTRVPAARPRHERAALAALACLAVLGTAAGCTDGTTPDCSDAQCLPVLVEAGPTDAPDDTSDAGETGDAPDAATLAPDGG